MAHVLSDKNINNKGFTHCETEYDKYFHGGKLSIYRRRFGKQAYISREKEIIISNFFNSLSFAQPVSTYRILDYGCGDGRLLPIYLEIAKFCETKNIKLEIICYDPSKRGLLNFEQDLISLDFRVQKEISFNDFFHHKYTKNNITISIINSGTIDIDQNTIDSFGKNFNLILLMFGVLSHVVSRQKRILTLSLLRKFMDESSRIVVNVPTAKHFKDSLEKYDNYRKKSQFNNLDLATEEGDIYYTRTDGREIIQNYYHLYNVKEFLQDLDSSDLKVKDLGILSVSQLPVLTRKKKFFVKFDTLMSKFFSSKFIPFWWTEKIGSYIFASAIIDSKHTNA